MPKAFINLLKYQLEMIVKFRLGLDDEGDRHIHHFLYFPTQIGPLLVHDIRRYLRLIKIIILHIIPHLLLLNEGAIHHHLRLLERTLSNILWHVAGESVVFIIATTRRHLLIAILHILITAKIILLVLLLTLHLLRLARELLLGSIEHIVVEMGRAWLHVT